MKKPEEAPYVRMMRKVKDTTPGFCWLFEGALDQNGHGNVKVRGGPWGWTCKKAHVVAYEYHKGSLPKNTCAKCGIEWEGWCEKCGKRIKKLVVRHTCDVRNCINPEHLIPGTHQENMQDMMERHRGKNQFKKKEVGECPF